jgi:cbb3-type cytochrome oxidase maturation protein
MTILWLLIPISFLSGAIGLALFSWAVRSGQYEDVDGAAERILDDEDRPL